MTSSPPPTVNLGMAVYVWGPRHQDRLLLECLAPALVELRRERLARAFCLDRGDARGPHIFAVITLPREAAPETAGRLAARIGSHLAAHPSTVTLTPEQLTRRHGESRLKRQCEMDGRPGFGTNNSFEIFEHPARGYPFGLSARLPGEEQLWDLVTDLTLWAIAQLTARPGSPAMAAALRWVASVERELRLAGVRPADYWRYHAATLIPDLLGTLEPEEQTAVLTELAADVGATSPTFAQAWQEIAEAGSVWPRLPGLVRLLLEGSPELPSPYLLPREITHIVLKQLGVPTILQIPLVLYAWRRSAL
jgi:hypothetical protein